MLTNGNRKSKFVKVAYDSTPSVIAVFQVMVMSAIAALTLVSPIFYHIQAYWTNRLVLAWVAIDVVLILMCRTGWDRAARFIYGLVMAVALIISDQLLGPASYIWIFLITGVVGTHYISTDDEVILRRSYYYICLLGVPIDILLHLSGFIPTEVPQQYQWAVTYVGYISVAFGVGLLMTMAYKFWRETQKLQLESEAKTMALMHQSKLASLGEMAAGLAHEINNPVAVISVSVSILRKIQNDPEKLHQRIEMIDRAASRIAKIVAGLKRVSRVREHSSFKTVNLLELVNESVLLTQMHGRRYDVKVRVEVPDDLNVECDEIEIEQVLVNLLTNAIDAVSSLSERWVELKASLEGDFVKFQVIDSGNGISREVEEKMFLPFFTTKDVGEGTGLGLSISKGIIEAHRGSIRINHRHPNTCIEFRIPLAG